MTMAAVYYVIQEAPAARVTGWLLRDLAINVVLLLVLLLTLLDAIEGSVVLDLRGAGWVALATSFLHPILVDAPHRRHHRADPAGSPVPQYLPDACVAIDWTLTALVVGALVVL